ncbi:hypothetical protein GCM10007913_33790 [Devosia yakushimensis]|uniref:Uncharacterized protein n=1 Tax=Devosia yakushimensis TaxID=470028 RepID=A0ABQ5UHC3_9HYPH|nr:hypothetical protein [Devosia yakushimensis]GLQ11447.1 hypothetical protein GCM10007913_33790 [Devosia yakushimensis]
MAAKAIFVALEQNAVVNFIVCGDSAVIAITDRGTLRAADLELIYGKFMPYRECPLLSAAFQKLTVGWRSASSNLLAGLVRAI